MEIGGQPWRVVPGPVQDDQDCNPLSSVGGWKFPIKNTGCGVKTSEVESCKRTNCNSDVDFYTTESILAVRRFWIVSWAILLIAPAADVQAAEEK